jgi:hypothetical protein
MRILVSIGAGCLLFSGDEACAQWSSPSISLKAGMIRNLQDQFFRDLPKYSLYREIEIKAPIAHASVPAITAYGSAYWGGTGTMVLMEPQTPAKTATPIHSAVTLLAQEWDCFWKISRCSRLALRWA